MWEEMSYNRPILSISERLETEPDDGEDININFEDDNFNIFIDKMKRSDLDWV